MVFLTLNAYYSNLVFKFTYFQTKQRLYTKANIKNGNKNFEFNIFPHTLLPAFGFEKMPKKVAVLPSRKTYIGYTKNDVRYRKNSAASNLNSDASRKN